MLQQCSRLGNKDVWSCSRCNAISSSDVLLLVGIDFGEGDFLRARELGGEFLVMRTYRFARPTPVRVDYE